MKKGPSQQIVTIVALESNNPLQSQEACWKQRKERHIQIFNDVYSMVIKPDYMYIKPQSSVGQYKNFTTANQTTRRFIAILLGDAESHQLYSGEEKLCKILLLKKKT